MGLVHLEIYRDPRRNDLLGEAAKIFIGAKIKGMGVSNGAIGGVI